MSDPCCRRPVELNQAAGDEYSIMKEFFQIRYSERIEETQLLGPGRRAVLWVHGCCFDCPGCIALNFRYGDYITASSAELAHWYLGTETEGLTISGGEPMLQASALAEMLVQIRKERDTGVIVYTGFRYEQLLEKAEQEHGIREFLNTIDILIDGPYMQEENHNEPYRGSANQRIIQLTERYKNQVGTYYFGESGRKIEIKVSGQKTLMVGVPSKDQAVIWSNIKLLEKAE